MNDRPSDRRIELEVEVEGTPDEVWQAIATGPGISSWYVPHVIEERLGGATVSSFGPEPEMQIPGVIVAWEPPNRVVFTGIEAGATLAFEWLVEARSGGSCVVRLVNSGFGEGDEWDAQFDGMSEGWRLFLTNLQLHLRHFRGRPGRAMLPMAMWGGSRDEVWTRLLAELGFPTRPSVDDVVRTSPAAPTFGGVVLQAAPHRLAVLLDEPAPGTAFVAAEATPGGVGVSVWAYFYGDDRDTIAEREEPRWRAWLNDPGRTLTG